jgi:hypothetical protein
MARESRFLDLRRLADWLSSRTSISTALAVERVIKRSLERLGGSSVPLLSRTLRGGDETRRTAAREALEFVASLDDGVRARVIAELKDIAGGASSDDGKLSAIGLLADLGASIRSTGIARFADPEAVQRRSAAALAAQLETAADVAKAADLMIRELEIADAVHMLVVMAEVAPAIAHRLAIELRARCDLPDELREQMPPGLGTITSIDGDGDARPRPARTIMLVDTAQRLVVIATRKLIGARRWRRWAVLVAPSGRIDDCLHEDDASEDVDALVEGLIDDGYRIVSRDHDDARDAVVAAARLTTAAHALPPAYYLGRDLLDLGNAHLSVLASAAPIDRAVELLASGDHAAASALLAEIEPLATGRSDRVRAVLGDAPHSADVAAATAACLLAQDRLADAAEWLARAIAAEPEWPLHHWNLAVALHRLGDAAGCFDALTRFVRTSAAPTGLAADPDQPARLACAEGMLRDLERAARLRGNALRTRRRRKRR